MANLISYGLDTIVASIIFYAGFLIMRRVTGPMVRRYYLLSTLVLVVLLPVVQLDISSDYLPENPVSLSTQSTFDTGNFYEVDGLNKSHSPAFVTDESRVKEAITINWVVVLTTGYFCIAVLFLFKMGMAVVSLLHLKNNAFPQIFEDQSVYVVKNPGFSGASFFGIIFIGEEIAKSQDLTYILKHEQIHVQRWHSVDVLLADVFRALFWINPVAWFYRSALRHATELETDYLVTQVVDRSRYANLLIKLSGSSRAEYILNNFSALRVKSRLSQMVKPIDNKWFIALVTVLFTVGTSFFMVSCQIEPEDTSIGTGVLGDLKSITSTFTSHQHDTQEKNARIVAVATFNTDGSLDEFNQHLTYPYNLEYVESRNFWTSPDPLNLHFIMDGLDLEYAENNLLYGNTWPGKFAETVKIGHPKFQSNEWRQYESAIDYGTNNLPKKIVTSSRMFLRNVSTADWIEEFTYENGKVSTSKRSYNYEFKESEEEKIKSKWVGLEEPAQVEYKYKDDNLISVSHRRRTIAFSYENNLLVSSELWIGETLYNTRRYTYHENGLKKQTDIFNLYGEPEYTIHYSYEFYE
ncbi:MAG: M56 family metallopeptidase [Bacteroidota bacterium]